MSLSQNAPSAPAGPVLRLALSLPIIGAMLRDMGRDVNIIFYYLVIAATALVLAVQVWGLAALVLTALALVPIMFGLIIWITLP